MQCFIISTSSRRNRRRKMSQNPKDKVEEVEEEEEEEEDDEDDEEEDDPLDNAINKTGCSDLAFTMQECMSTKKDWRACNPHMLAFKACMDKYQKQKA